ncbi:MAG TPA: hypothetical protein VK906_14895 [Egicoccus sp.]|nr:hypothetical protein [Egicoccus sp.]HSK24471.1 hypothetical protein [Egicoccus sp.]
MRWFWMVVLVAVGAFVLDRLLTAAEDRGWVYWRKSSPSTGSAGIAMLSVQAIFEPDKQHVVDERLRQAAEIEEAEDDEPLPPPQRRPH